MEKKGEEVVGSTRLGKGRYIPRKEAETTGRESGDPGGQGTVGMLWESYCMCTQIQPYGWSSDVSKKSLNSHHKLQKSCFLKRILYYTFMYWYLPVFIKSPVLWTSWPPGPSRRCTTRCFIPLCSESHGGLLPQTRCSSAGRSALLPPLAAHTVCRPAPLCSGWIFPEWMCSGGSSETHSRYGRKEFPAAQKGGPQMRATAQHVWITAPSLPLTVVCARTCPNRLFRWKDWGLTQSPTATEWQSWGPNPGTWPRNPACHFCHL